MNLLKIKEKISSFPQNPGVYFFYDKNKEIVYIGKATNLKSRVSSYFRNYKGSDRPIETMIDQVKDVEARSVESVLEALILEANLIWKYQPKYNVLGKDDKSYSYFIVTKEEFPRILIARETDLDESSKMMENTKIRVKYAKSFGPYTSRKQMEIALKIIRRIFPFHSISNNSEKGCLDFQLGRCPGPHSGAISKEDYRKNIYGIKMILEGNKKNLVKKMEKEMQIFAKKNEFEKATEMRDKIFALRHIQDVALINRDEEDLGLDVFSGQKKTKPLRIEAYDISNISGVQAVGSMVVFEGKHPNKSQYRKFRIKTVKGANDVAMMKEVLIRRLKNDWTQPDLIILDGGKGHLNMAKKLMDELGLVIPLASVAKGAQRKNLDVECVDCESIASPEAIQEIRKILQNKNLLKHITDEAHRFAIGYHRKIRKREYLIDRDMALQKE